MEKHFLTFINYQQDDGPEKLTMAEFAAYKNKSVSAKLSPFFATKGLHPCMSFDKVEFSNISTCKQIFN